VHACTRKRVPYCLTAHTLTMQYAKEIGFLVQYLGFN